MLHSRALLLERPEEGCSDALQTLPNLCQTACGQVQIHQRQFLIWHNTHGVHFYGSSGQVFQNNQWPWVCLDSHLHAHRLCLLHPTEIKECRINCGQVPAFTFWNSRKMSDNGTEFTNSLFEDVAKLLGVECKIYSPVYRPQANRWIECFHKFLKEYIAKHIVGDLEWDDVLPLPAAGYNGSQTNTQKKPHSFWCLGEMLWHILLNSSNLREDT